VSKITAHAVFAARLVQARLLRGLSQRALGDRMGLGKQTGSTRINRYEQQVSAIGFDSLIQLAETLNVPMAYLLADSAPVADAILALSQANPAQQADTARLLQALSAKPEMLNALLRLLDLPVTDGAEDLPPAVEEVVPEKRGKPKRK
jgi:transcriptional regulator with XRE-family HTH domain